MHPEDARHRLAQLGAEPPCLEGDELVATWRGTSEEAWASWDAQPFELERLLLHALGLDPLSHRVRQVRIGPGVGGATVLRAMVVGGG